MEDGSIAVYIVIDEINGYMEIDGAKVLKTACFEVYSYIVDRVKEQKKPATHGQDKPAGAKCWLPFLPPCGIDGMTSSAIELYWNQVMRAVLPNRGRYLGYVTPK